MAPMVRDNSMCRTMKPDDQFSRLAKRLVGAYPYEPWPEAPWLNLLKSEFQCEHADALYQDCEDANRVAIESAIDAWLSGRPWPPMTDIQAYLLGVRVDSVACFLLELSTPDNVLACRAIPDDALLRWFLVQWWNYHGSVRYFINRWE